MYTILYSMCNNISLVFSEVFLFLTEKVNFHSSDLANIVCMISLPARHHWIMQSNTCCCQWSCIVIDFNLRLPILWCNPKWRHVTALFTPWALEFLLVHFPIIWFFTLYFMLFMILILVRIESSVSLTLCMKILCFLLKMIASLTDFKLWNVKLKSVTYL